MNAHSLAVALIPRDKFSVASDALRATYADLPADATAWIYDSDYPEGTISQLREVAREAGRELVVRRTERFANTNRVWNQFTAECGADVLICIENDVIPQRGCLAELSRLVVSGYCDVAVPVVHEGTYGALHFDPVISRLTDTPEGVTSELLRRPKDGMASPGTLRVVDHLERHCFAMTARAAARLGNLDEQMYCRTDLDISLACHAARLTVAVTPEANVVFRRDPDLSVDRDFFDFRWNIERVAFANTRLINKWHLIGYKTTINHAHRIRRLLCEPTGSGR